MSKNCFFGMSPENIHKDSPIPYHYQLRELLRDEINTGCWEVGERLPSEREICETFELSRTTVREAMDALVNEGMLRREKGRGTFVADPKIMEHWLDLPDSFTDAMQQQGYRVDTKVLNSNIIVAPHKVREELRLKANEHVIVLDRLRSILNEPILVVTSYLTESICPGLNHEDFTKYSLYQVLREKYQINIASAKRCMEAVAANELEANLLHIKIGAPLMMIESTAYLEDGTPVEYFKARHRGDRTRFQVESFKFMVPRSP
jgi:GntR family transcriptional regulator